MIKRNFKEDVNENLPLNSPNKIINKKIKIININERNKYLFVLILFFIFLLDNFFLSQMNKKYNIKKSFKKYLNDCSKSKNYNRIKIMKKCPYLSICISALNMEKYIKKNIFSIINQSFQDFEIIVVNDNSDDNTEKIIKQMQEKDYRIIIINHSQNLGVYKSRIESILKAKGEYIMLMDPDDMYLNVNLFEKLFKYNKNLNIDIIEFSVYRQFEKSNKIFFPNNHFENHYHEFKSIIIYQPELSNLLYFLPNTQKLSYIICRNIWNKMIRKEIYLKMYKYIGLDYFNEYVITGDDICMNIISYHFSNNFSNIELPGYLYNIREVSMSNGDGGIKLKRTRSINYFLYFNVFYKYIKEFNKDRNFLFYEMKYLKNFLINIKDYNITKYMKKEIDFINDIIVDNYLSEDFKKYLKDLQYYFSHK